MEKVIQLEKELENVIEKINEYTTLSSWRFKQDIKEGEKISLDERKWERKRQPFHWSLKDFFQ